MNEVDDLPSSETAPTLLGFCDENWSHQDASLPNNNGPFRLVCTNETHIFCRHVRMMGVTPVDWKCHTESRTSHSYCKAEVKATDECSKSVQMFCHVLGEMGLIHLTQATAIYNDNNRAVDWSNSFSTKGMRHVNICKNDIHEAIRESNEITVSHIPEQSNPADISTKEFKPDVTFHTL